MPSHCVPGTRHRRRQKRRNQSPLSVPLQSVKVNDSSWLKFHKAATIFDAKMPLFSSNNTFDADVDKVTNETNTSEDWSLIMEICDRVGRTANGPKECLKSIMKRVNHKIPHVAIQALTLLDACMNNCGQIFHLEICTRPLSLEIRNIIQKHSNAAVGNKMKELLQKWAHMLKDDPKVTLIPTLYNSLKNEGVEFPAFTPEIVPGGAASSNPTESPNFTSTSNKNQPSSDRVALQEDEDLARAIEMSLRDADKTGASHSSHSTTVNTSTPATYSQTSTSSIYPVVKPPSPKSLRKELERRKVLALYDFEAAEDNELTFKAGDIISIIDDSDPNWWKGETPHGSGLFPSNFVTSDLNEPVPKYEVHQELETEVVEESEVQNGLGEAKQPSMDEYKEVQIDEEKIDITLEIFGKADITVNADTQELIDLEDTCNRMKYQMTNKLERLETKDQEVNTLKNQFEETLALYQKLMQERPRYSSIYAAYSAAGLQPVPQQQVPQQQVPQQPVPQQPVPQQHMIPQQPNTLGYQQQPTGPQNFSPEQHPMMQGLNQQPQTTQSQQNMYNPVNQSSGTSNEFPVQQSQYYHQQQPIDPKGVYSTSQGGTTQQQPLPQMNAQPQYNMYPQAANQFNSNVPFTQPHLMQ
ncbi:Signal transducing adapter molecule 2 [Trichoplax sp. H2]|nr:Signal transducing adapter molecule 2 [Trichoplax sp. H2]|eukprot:RDD39520.1 Signal transducing adapter molecule 2 [Trichoplax sp. H2]